MFNGLNGSFIKYLRAYRWINEVKYFKEMKGLKSLPVKAETYVEPKLASMMKLFCKNS